MHLYKIVLLTRREVQPVSGVRRCVESSSSEHGDFRECLRVRVQQIELLSSIDIDNVVKLNS